MHKNEVLIKNTVYMDRNAQFHHGDLHIADGKIIAIGEALPVPEEATVIDGHHQLTLPGLINTHTHVAMTLLRGYGGNVDLDTWLNQYIWPAEANLTEEDVYYGTALGLLEMLSTGTTTFADMYESMEAVAEITVQAGMRANLSRGMIGINASGEKALAENDTLFTNWHGANKGLIEVSYGPHAPYTCPPAFLEKVVAHAQANNARIHIHLAETQKEMEDTQKLYGKTPTAYLESAGVFEQPTLLAHGIYFSEEDYETLAQHETAIAHNPASNMKLASGVAPIEKLRSHGIQVALGTDGASSNNRLDMFRDMNLAALLHKVHHLSPMMLPAAEVLKMATIDGAKALGIEDKTGSLEVGKEADIIMIDIDKPAFAPYHDHAENLAYGATGSDVVLTMVAGNILYQHGEWLTLDKERILHEAEKSAKRIIQ